MQGDLKSGGSLLILLIAYTAMPVAQAKPAYVPQVGDIVFHTSTSSQSKAVQAATRSPYSHMGVVLFRQGKPVVFEAVQPVKYTPLQAWLDRGQGGRYVVKRPRQALTPAQQTRLSQSAQPFVGKPYDLTFEWSDARIYCSELVWKMYEQALGLQLAPLAKLGSFDLRHPAVQAKLRERYGQQVPLNEPVISPQAVFDSPLLTTVASR